MGLRAKIAPTVWLFGIDTVQVALVRFTPPMQFEDQPTNTEPAVGVSVNVTVGVELKGKFAVQLALVPPLVQLIPTGLLTTVPVPWPNS